MSVTENQPVSHDETEVPKRKYFETMSDDELRSSPDFYAWINFLASDYLEQNPDTKYDEINQKFHSAKNFIDASFLNQICNLLMQRTQRESLEKDGLVWNNAENRFLQKPR